MNNTHQRRPGGPYLSRNGLIFGVCRGGAEHLNFSVIGLRCIAVAATIFTGFWPGIIVYIVAALVLKPEPLLEFDSESDAEFYGSYNTSSTMALSRLKESFDSLDRRVQRMESIVTAPDYSWDERLNGDG